MSDPSSGVSRPDRRRAARYLIDRGAEDLLPVLGLDREGVELGYERLGAALTQRQGEQ